MNWGANLKMSPVRLKHSELKRFSEESAYRSVCPICETGVLLVGRNQETFGLVAYDRCTWCAQAVIYEDECIGGEGVESLPAGFEESMKEYAEKLPSNMFDGVN